MEEPARAVIIIPVRTGPSSLTSATETADPSTPVATVEGSLVWGIEGVRGVYVAPIAYDEAGEWGVELTTAAPGGPEESIRGRYQVDQRGGV